MKRRLRSELKMSKPFASLEEELAVEIQRTGQSVIRWISEALRPSGLTPAQFNVLRILRGARPGSLSGSEIASRMVADDPDLTRLFDRLEAAGLIEKERDTRDRRVVNVRISAAGLDRVETATQAVRKRLESEWKALGAKKMESLADLLEAARGVPD